MEIKELRLKLGLTQVMLASLLHVAPFTVRRWEAGKFKPLPVIQVRLRELEAIAIASKHRGH